MTSQQLNALLDERAAADFLNVSIKTVQGWRLRRTGPRFYRISNRIRYSLDDLQQYLSTCAVEPETSR
jgi:Helix-turn-helix domain